MKVMRAILYGMAVAGMLLVLPGCKPSQKLEKGSMAGNASGGGGGDEKLRQQIDYLFVEASTQYIQGNNEEAIKLYQEILEKDSKHGASLYNISKIELEQNNLESAIKYGKQALDLDPENYWYYVNLEKAYEGKYDYSKALGVQEQLVRKFPEDKDAKFDLAQLYIQTRKYAESVKVYDQLEQMVGYNEELLIRKHQLWLQLNDPEKAIAEVDKLIAFNPLDSRFYQMKYDILEATGQSERAQAVMAKMLEVNPTDGFAMLSMADYYRTQGDMDKSDEYLFKAFRAPDVELESKLQILTGLYGPAKASPDMLDRLQSLNNILLAQFPENALVNGIQGDIFQLAENPDSSLHYYRRSLEIDPSNEQVWQEILLVESETEDYASLQKDAEKALEFFPNRVAFLYFYGMGSQQTGNYDEAIYAYDKLRKSAGGDPELMLQAYISLGEVYFRNENYPKSDESFEKALEMDPENALVLNNFAYFLSLRNEKLDKAAEMVQKALSKNPNSSAYLDTYGWILYLQGNYQKATEYLERAVFQGGTGEVMEHYGDALIKLGQREKAEEFWKKAKETGQTELNVEQKLKENNLK